MKNSHLIHYFIFKLIRLHFENSYDKYKINATKNKIMIQRKQTLLLLIVVILMGLTFLLPSSIGIISSEMKNYHNVYEIMPFDVVGTSIDQSDDNLFSTTFLGLTITFSIGLTIFIISRFRNLVLQFRLTVALMMLLVVIECQMIYYGYKLISILNLSSDVQNPFPLNWGAAMPVISIIVSYFAFRMIVADYLIIKSLNSNRMR